MKAALIADRIWLLGELSTLRRLVVGLVDEQVRVVRVVPDDLGGGEDDALSITSTELRYEWSQWRWTRDWMLRDLREPLREADVDLLHVLDGSLCAAGLRLARRLQLPLICSVWSQREIEQLPGVPADVALTVAAPTHALTALARRRLEHTSATVEYVPAGVYRSVDDVPPPLAEPDGSLSCVIAGDGWPDEAYAALLHGMAAVREKIGQAVYFFHSVASDQHRLWQMAERLDLLKQVSLVPYGRGSRQLLVQGDVVIQPQPLGQVRTLVLEAMAASRPVIAAADPMLDYLIDDQTARLVPDPAHADWAELLTSLVEHADQYVALGDRARDYIGHHHSAGRSVERMVDLYRRATAQPLPFSA